MVALYCTIGVNTLNGYWSLLMNSLYNKFTQIQRVTILMINLHGSIILYNRSNSSSSSRRGRRRRSSSSSGSILFYMYNTLFTVYCTIGVNTLNCY